jgi:RNA recognition motif-containing protein
MKIYVGNMSFDTNEDTLRGVFAEHGSVDEVAVITDRDTGRPRGFAFVTMTNDSDARNVSESRPKPQGGGGGGGRGRRGSW